ncbi:O-antigen polymerase [Sphaerotilus sp.]|uniref:O-antigen polymerase n=1 Tax=Sphaerotilus sp. TaxID=2093942 RepID=UPI0025EB199B|nr:O-antigen polymerase [Sphaerotilus sp.]
MTMAMTTPHTQPATTAMPMPWWCSPAGIAVGFLLPLMVLISYAGGLPHPALTIRGVEALNAHYLQLGAMMILAIALTGWLGAQLQFSATPVPRDVRAWDRAALGLGSIATFAFVVWFRDFVFNPVLLFQTLTGEFKPDRNTIELTPGLTSLANMGPVFFSVYAFRLLDKGEQALPRAMHTMFVVLGLFTLFRVYVWTERLALIELLVPFGLTFGRWTATRHGSGWALTRTVGPYAAIPLVILFFGASEYFRSWSSDTYQGKMDFWEFALGRFASYYYTSLNNGAGLLANTEWPTWTFEFTLEWLHRAPFGLGKPFSQAVGYTVPRLDYYLATYQDEEFNSPSGIYSPLSDMGLYGGLGYMLAIGLVSGLCFRAYREARLAGVLFYPIFFITFMEIYRYPYLGVPRAFTWTLGIGVALLLASTVKPLPAHSAS